MSEVIIFQKDEFGHFKKGYTPWNKGLTKETDERVKRLSELYKGKMVGDKNPMWGKHPSEETRKKIGNGNRGKILSGETKKKIGKASKGRVPWCKGKKLSPEIVEKRKSIFRNIKCKFCNKEFSTNSNKRIYCCKECKKEAYKDKARENLVNYNIRYPGKKALSSKVARLKRKFNLTIEEHDKLLQSQNNICKVCSIVLNTGDWNKKSCVDHNHKSGKIRGILCSKCNKGIGHFNDDINLLINAQKYLEGNL